MYYEEQTRNGKQWFRITPNGDWMPKLETKPEYDRAGMAYGFAKTMLGNVTEFNQAELEMIPIDAVKFTDALIAELQRTAK